MSPRPTQWAIPIAVGLGLPISLYVTFILLGSVPFFQRHFFYAHRINTLFWHDLDQPEYWGFARNQVTPFTLTSPDGGSIYTWHILPLQSYSKHEERLQAGPGGFSNDITVSESFQILRNDPDAKLVVSFHGNAGHIAQGMRTEHFHALTDGSKFHVLTIDYRGYGKSTGFPSEAGLIQDGVTVVDWAMNIAGIPPSRIVIIGQSLGTAVTSGVAEYYVRQGIEFAGVVLVAGFSNVPHLLTGYSGGGVVPVLSPFRHIPPLLRFFQSFVVDRWESASRLADVVRLTRKRLRLTLIHAKDDKEIPCLESDVLFKAAANAMIEGDQDDDEFLSWKKQRSIYRDDGTFITTVQAEPDIVVRQELVPYGGHNNVLISSVITLAVMRSFAPDANDLI